MNPRILLRGQIGRDRMPTRLRRHAAPATLASLALVLSFLDRRAALEAAGLSE